MLGLYILHPYHMSGCNIPVEQFNRWCIDHLHAMYSINIEYINISAIALI